MLPCIKLCFSHRNTNNCINVSTDAPPLTPDQHAFLKASDSQNEIHIFSDLNKANERHWGRLIWDFMGRYKTAGIQTYLHKGYQTVQCKGPYVPQWKGRNVMWHPSVLGHELRAGRHVYFMTWHTQLF